MLVAKKNVLKNTGNQNDIFAKCRKCGDKFLSRYWDDEISWYIEVNVSNVCHTCREKASLQLCRKTNVTKDSGPACRGTQAFKEPIYT